MSNSTVRRGGLIDVALIEVNGVHVRQGEGLPRLDTLFIPPEPEETPALEERVNIRSIRISDVNVEDYRPDGTLVKVRKLQLEGKAGIEAGQATFDVQIPEGEGRAEIRRKDGGTFRLPMLKLALNGQVDLASKELRLKLPSQTMPLFVQVPDLEALEDSVELGGLSAVLRPDRVDIDLNGIKVADLTLKRFQAEFRIGPDMKLQVTRP